jgi:Ni,Fe-hydrogenase I cytochrome b subunit
VSPWVRALPILALSATGYLLVVLFLKWRAA